MWCEKWAKGGGEHMREEGGQQVGGGDSVLWR